MKSFALSLVIISSYRAVFTVYIVSHYCVCRWTSPSLIGVLLASIRSLVWPAGDVVLKFRNFLTDHVILLVKSCEARFDSNNFAIEKMNYWVKMKNPSKTCRLNFHCT